MLYILGVLSHDICLDVVVESVISMYLCQYSVLSTHILQCESVTLIRVSIIICSSYTSSPFQVQFIDSVDRYLYTIPIYIILICNKYIYHC